MQGGSLRRRANAGLPSFRGAKAMRILIIVERIRANLWRSGGECTGRTEFRAHATEPVAQPDLTRFDDCAAERNAVASRFETGEVLTPTEWARKKTELRSPAVGKRPGSDAELVVAADFFWGTVPATRRNSRGC